MEVKQNPFLYDTSIKSVKKTNTITNSIKPNSLERTVNQDTVSFSSSKKEKSELRKEFDEIKSQQGGIGQVWDGIKNFFGAKSGSKKVEDIIKKAEKGEISQEEAKQAIENYKEGQKTCVDVVADLFSGMLAVGAFALAVPTGGTSLAVGLTMATAVGAGVKTGIKVWDAKATGKEYNGKDLLYDVATGGINGLLAPVTNGLGNTVTKTIGQKLGLKIVQEGAEEVAEQAVKQGFKQAAKSAVLNQTLDVAGGSVSKRAVALGAGMAFDGALGGASDNMVRAALNGENIIKAGVQGAIGGMIMAPVIGGGFRVAGKAGKALNNKITTKIVLPDGIKTKFNQGQVGDCALLATIDGMMNNPQTAKNIKKSITKTIGGDYNVKIGDQVVRVAKSSLSDEMLSDKTGIRIFEQAYKQLTGDIDGGFAEVVAKQFGLNPVHITKESITDELLDKLAKNQGDTVLSFGALVDEAGQISEAGQRHYFTIKNIDPETKMVTLTSPVDTSVEVPASYEQIKTMGISIDGGTTKPMDLPNVARSADDVKFKGVEQQDEFWEENPYLDVLRYRIYEDAGAYSLIDDAPYVISAKQATKSELSNINFDYVGMQDFNIKNLTLATNKKGIRGSSIFAKPNKKYLSELSNNGITQVIDLRAESKLMQSTQICEINGLEYTFFPVFYEKKLTPQEIQIVKDTMPNFIKAMDKGNFYIGCSEGTNRTDVAFALNYLFNPNETVIPMFESKTPQKSLQMTMQIITAVLDRDKAKQYHVPEDFIKSLGWEDADSFLAELETRLKKLNTQNIKR